jgi:hypothetical protein
MRRYLVVANQTLGGEQLTAKLAECTDAIRKLASREEADEIIVSTCRNGSRGGSRWTSPAASGVPPPFP